MNENIKKYAKDNNVKLWQIADKLGVCDTGFSKRLRHPLSRVEENKIFAIVDEIAIDMKGRDLNEQTDNQQRT